MLADWLRARTQPSMSSWVSALKKTGSCNWGVGCCPAQTPLYCLEEEETDKRRDALFSRSTREEFIQEKLLGRAPCTFIRMGVGLSHFYSEPERVPTAQHQLTGDSCVAVAAGGARGLCENQSGSRAGGGHSLGEEEKT
ncbi:hypothetical protein EYF80_040715 [Liparis tanakae]|uniref:Uncharacterized protein n=1 Tax=Liparis tanakae TaxID=230148 RepID=A0A4Z2G7K6_9TELE|nr:hypothetical protein EYF80_040715 [Liparis tanakae]